MPRGGPRSGRWLAAACGAALLAWPAGCIRAESIAKRPVYRSPLDVAFSPDGRLVAVSDHTAGALVVVSASTRKVVREVRLRGRPAGVAWSADGRSVYVAECSAGTVAEVDLAGKVRRRLRVPAWPTDLALAPRRGRLLVTSSALHCISVVDLAAGRETARVAVLREPSSLAVTPDERLAVVGNRLPAGSAADPNASAAVTLIDLATAAKVGDIRLPANSVNVLGVACSPDGRWAYVGHNLARTALPTRQVEFGWISANAVSVLDLRRRQRHVTVLIDGEEDGAANPWGLAVSPRGGALWIALSGVHQLGRLDLAGLHRALPAPPENDGTAAPSPPAEPAPTRRAASVQVVVSDEPTAYVAGVYVARAFARFALPGKGPRGVAISPDGRHVAAAMYYSGDVAFVATRTGRALGSTSLAPQPKVDDARLGEMVFHDATRCSQNWLSCATCHPDGRADGLNWDLLNDGVGNPKNTRSLLWSHRTPPTMSLGVRADMATATTAGFRHILFRLPVPDELRAVRAYLRSLTPAESPHRHERKLTRKAAWGKVLFRSPTTGCTTCHPAPLYTDLKMYDVGTHVQADGKHRAFDTPTLVELWRTGPYLHHGRAATLREVLTRFNRKDRHGHTSHLSAEEIDALVEYLESL